ncbi:hypothetical protein C8R43DRAFT_948394 [Mycena crocata]|nr:hypothetical protein C8R43DRAFT_948394 [Mycena crocata]
MGRAGLITNSNTQAHKKPAVNWLPAPNGLMYHSEENVHSDTKPHFMRMRNQCARTSDTRAEIALRRVEEQEEIARSTAELETQWESEAWNAAVDAAFRDVSPGPPLFCDFLAKNFPDSPVPADDSMSMDLGYESSNAGSSNDDGIEQHWSQPPIVCERSGDAEQVSQDWAALNLMLGTTRQMGPGDRQSNLDDVHPFVRRSLELGHPHPSRAPSHAHATKTKLLTLHKEFITDRTAAPGVDLDSELVHLLVTRAYICSKACQARGMMENQRCSAQLVAQNRKIGDRLSKLAGYIVLAPHQTERFKIVKIYNTTLLKLGKRPGSLLGTTVVRRHYVAVRILKLRNLVPDVV